MPPAAGQEVLRDSRAPSNPLLVQAVCPSIDEEGRRSGITLHTHHSPDPLTSPTHQYPLNRPDLEFGPLNLIYRMFLRKCDDPLK